eukprot:3484864-Rhodomonas_salina.1
MTPNVRADCTSASSPSFPKASVLQFAAGAVHLSRHARGQHRTRRSRCVHSAAEPVHFAAFPVARLLPTHTASVLDILERKGSRMVGRGGCYLDGTEHRGAPPPVLLGLHSTGPRAHCPPGARQTCHRTGPRQELAARGP